MYRTHHFYHGRILSLAFICTRDPEMSCRLPLYSMYTSSLTPSTENGFLCFNSIITLYENSERENSDLSPPTPRHFPD